MNLKYFLNHSELFLTRWLDIDLLISTSLLKLPNLGGPVTRQMGRKGTKMPSFCLNRIRSLARVRSQPPPIHSKSHADFTSANTDHEKKKEKSGDGMKAGVMIGRKIMIVVDSSSESKNALQWALTHTVQSQDMVFLLHVTKRSKRGLGSWFYDLYLD